MPEEPASSAGRGCEGRSSNGRASRARACLRLRAAQACRPSRLRCAAARPDASRTAWRGHSVRQTGSHTPGGADSEHRGARQLFVLPKGSVTKACPSSCCHLPSTMNLYWWYLRPTAQNNSQGEVEPQKCEGLRAKSRTVSRTHGAADPGLRSCRSWHGRARGRGAPGRQVADNRKDLPASATVRCHGNRRQPVGERPAHVHLRVGAPVRLCAAAQQRRQVLACCPP